MARLAEPLDPAKTGSKADHLERSLSKLIVGQQEAIREIVSIYQMHLTGLNPPGRPIGNFLFLGPTGTGKTRIVEAVAESLVGSARAVVKVDCGEFQHSHEIAKLIGSPPGYLGHRETHPLLSQETLNQHHTASTQMSFVLFDEIEKASDSLWNLLLGILDKATLTLGDNRRVDFCRALVFMTSNLGAAEMGSILNPRLGLGVHAETPLRELDEKTAGQNLAGGHRSGQTQIHSGVRQSAGQDRRLPATRGNRVETGARHRTRLCPAADFRLGGSGPLLRVPNPPPSQGLSASRWYGPEVRCAASETDHRTPAGAALIQPGRQRANPGRGYGAGRL